MVSSGIGEEKVRDIKKSTPSAQSVRRRALQKAVEFMTRKHIGESDHYHHVGKMVLVRWPEDTLVSSRRSPSKEGHYNHWFAQLPVILSLVRRPFQA